MSEPTCPKCSGAMWNNTQSKLNPKQPDYKCKDKTCDGVIWPPRPGQTPRAAAPAQQKQAYSSGPALPYETNVETGAPPQTTTAKLDILFALYGVCLGEAIQQAEKMNKADIGTTPESVAAMAATLFIQANQRGIAV